MPRGKAVSLAAKAVGTHRAQAVSYLDDAHLAQIENATPTSLERWGRVVQEKTVAGQGKDAKAVKRSRKGSECIERSGKSSGRSGKGSKDRGRSPAPPPPGRSV